MAVSSRRRLTGRSQISDPMARGEGAFDDDDEPRNDVGVDALFAPVEDPRPLLDAFAVLRLDDVPEQHHPDPGRTLSASSSPPLIHRRRVAVLRERRVVDEFPAGIDALLRHPARWRVAAAHIGDFLSLAEPDSTVGICALCMALVAVGELTKEPDAGAVFPESFPSDEFKQVRDLLGHGGKYAAKLALHDEDDLLFGLQLELLRIRTACDSPHDAVRLLAEDPWTATKKLAAIFASADPASRRCGSEDNFARRVEQLSDVLSLLLVDGSESSDDFESACRSSLVGVLKNRTGHGTKGLRAALSFLFIDLVAFLTDKGLVACDYLSANRNVLAHLGSHVSDMVGAEKVISGFFVLVWSEQLRISSALAYLAYFDGETGSEDYDESNPCAVALGEIVEIYRTRTVFTRELVERTICAAFPAVVLDIRGFLLFAASLENVDWMFLARNAQWKTLLELLRCRPWKNMLESEGDKKSTVVHLAAASWVSNTSKTRSDLSFLAESVKKAALKVKFEEGVRKEITDVLKSLRANKLCFTFETFCKSRPLRRNGGGNRSRVEVPCSQYVQFVVEMVGLHGSVDRVLHETNGQTALHISARTGFSEVVKVLVVKLRADRYVECGAGKLAFFYAAKAEGFDESVLFLLMAPIPR